MRLQHFARLIAVAGITVATTLVAAPAPAHAAVGLYRVENVSASNLSSPKNASVSCPGADIVVGMGGTVIGSPDVPLTRVYVDAGLRTVTASGYEAVATSNAWSVKVFAVCAPAGTLAAPQLVEVTSGSDPNDKIVTANCPNGRLAFGGGFKLEDAYGQVGIGALEFDLHEVQTRAYVHGTVGNFRLTTQAICGEPANTFVITYSDSASNSISPKAQTSPNCPSGTPPFEVMSVGAIVTGGLGEVALTSLSPRLNAGAAEAKAREIGAYSGSWELRTQIMCLA